MKKVRKLLTKNLELWLPLREQKKFGRREEYRGDIKGEDNSAL